MRFSLLTLFGVMTAAAVLLGVPGYVYGVVGLLLLSVMALAAFVLLVQAPVDSAMGFLQLFVSRQRLEDYNNPPFGVETEARDTETKSGGHAAESNVPAAQKDDSAAEANAPEAGGWGRGSAEPPA